MRRRVIIALLSCAVFAVWSPLVGAAAFTAASDVDDVRTASVPRADAPEPEEAARASASGTTDAGARRLAAPTGRSGADPADSSSAAPTPAPDATADPAAGATPTTASGAGASARPSSSPAPAPAAAAPAPAPAPVAAPAPPACPSGIGGGFGGAPSRVSSGGVAGTTSDDLASFAAQYNSIRVANCLQPVPAANFRYDSCMEDRLFWMAEDPSTDPASAWGHRGSVRSDGVPDRGCDGNLAGGYGNTGATVAQKWWDSTAHRASLYRPEVAGSTTGVCIYLAVTHGGVPDEPYSFTRAAARWGGC